MKNFLKPTKAKVFLTIVLLIIGYFIIQIYAGLDVDLCPLQLPISINSEQIPQPLQKRDYDDLPFMASYSHSIIDEWNHRYGCNPEPDSKIQVIFKSIKTSILNPYVLLIFTALLSYIVTCTIFTLQAKLKNKSGNKKK